MADEGIHFGHLSSSDERREQWLRSRQEAIQYVEGLNCKKALEQLADTFEIHFKKEKRLPSHDELPARVAGFASLLGVSMDDDSHLQDQLHQVVVVTRALALFLGRRKPSMRRLQAVASIEFFVDVRLLAKQIATGPGAKTWLKSLRSMKLEVKTINDDTYQASDETERWARELPKPVPTWHVGNFPRMDQTPALLVSAILREMDEGAWLLFMDRLPLPLVMESLLWEARAEHEPERLLDWLGRAPPVFDAEGQRNSSALAYVLERRALSMLQDYLRQRAAWNASQEQQQTLLESVRPAIEDLVEALKSRSDGSVLLTELAARLVRMDKFGVGESPNSELQAQLRHWLALEYLEGLGGMSEARTLLQARAAGGTSEGEWDYWLCACALAVSLEESTAEVRRETLRLCWPWLADLLRGRDVGLVQEYRQPAAWTERLAGLALAACDYPLEELEGVWGDLAAQRTRQEVGNYKEDMWATSRFLLRAGYWAHHEFEDDQSAGAMWWACTEMAVSAWFRRTSLEPFDEVATGLAHLAKCGAERKDQLIATLRYLVGLPSEFARAAVVLVENGLPPDLLRETAAEAGIDTVAYLATSQEPRIQEQVARLLGQLRGPSQGHPPQVLQPKGT